MIDVGKYFECDNQNMYLFLLDFTLPNFKSQFASVVEIEFVKYYYIC